MAAYLAFILLKMRYIAAEQTKPHPDLNSPSHVQWTRSDVDR
jgi:hypothetical protein